MKKFLGGLWAVLKKGKTWAVVAVTAVIAAAIWMIGKILGKAGSLFESGASVAKKVIDNQIDKSRETLKEDLQENEDERQEDLGNNPFRD